MDINADGHNNCIYQNNGDSTYTRISTKALVNDITCSVNTAWCDADSDGFQDILLCNNINTNSFYHNQGNFEFANNYSNVLLSSRMTLWEDFVNDGNAD
jgi:hypothetical protein